LENAIERAAALAETEIIQAADLPPSILEAVKAIVPVSATESQATAVLPSVSEATLYPLRTGVEPRPEGASQQITADSITPLKTFLREQEQAHLQRAMDACGGDKEQAAILLGVSLATLYRKLTGEEKDV
jgi:DNA-binding NtrC family response regulator